MEKVVVEIEWVKHNFAAHVPKLKGCVATGATPAEVKQMIKEAIAGHVEISREHGDPLPEAFAGDYELVYKFDAQSLLKYYKGILGNTGIERLTGISNKQLNHYATGLRKPTERTKIKIETALHEFGRELMAVEL